jgi:hypothetical protein
VADKQVLATVDAKIKPNIGNKPLKKNTDKVKKEMQCLLRPPVLLADTP